jgi:hypothetical protein
MVSRRARTAARFGVRLLVPLASWACGSEIVAGAGDAPATCPSSETPIYAIGDSNTLYGFNPTTAAFSTIGTIAFPSPPHPGSETNGAFGLTVGQEGTLYVASLWGIYRVNTQTAAAELTPYKPYGVLYALGFVGDVSGRGGETLFYDVEGGPESGLETMSTTTFAATPVGTVQANGGQLTGTGDGRLFMLSTQDPSGVLSIVQIDPKTAEVLSRDTVPGVTTAFGVGTFAFWGGDFYLFERDGVDAGASSVVDRFDPVRGKVTRVGMGPSGDPLRAAGVSTCAPTHG